MSSYSEEEILRENESLMNRIRKDPSIFLTKISSGECDQFTYQVVVNFANLDPIVARSGGAQIFISHIMNGIKFQEDPTMPNSQLEKPVCGWESPLNGLVNILSTLRRCPSIEYDERVLADVRASYHDVCNILIRDLRHLVQSDSASEHRRVLVSGFMSYLMEFAKNQEAMIDEISLELMTHCWLYMSSSAESRRVSTRCILFIIERASPSAPFDIADRIERLASIDLIIKNISRVLDDVEALQQNLEMELDTVYHFMQSQKPYAPAFITQKFYEPLARALQMQMKIGDNASHANVNVSVYLAMDQMFAIPKVSTLYYTDMIQEQTGVMAAMALGLVLSHKYQQKTWIQFVERLIHLLTCSDSTCVFKKSPGYEDSARKSLENTYFQTIRAISPSPHLAVFLKFALLLGVSEKSLFEKWQTDKECCNPFCELRGGGSPAMACSGCGLIYYHGSHCQKMDWKRHKADCKKAPSQK